MPTDSPPAYLSSSNVSWVLSGTVLYATHICVFPLACYLFLHTSQRQRYPVLFAAAHLGAVTLSTCIWALQVVVAVPFFRLRAPGETFEFHVDSDTLLRYAFILYVVSHRNGNFIIGLNIFTFVLWPRWVTIGMLAIWLADLGTGIAGIATCLVIPDSCVQLQVSNLALSLVFNSIATTLLVRVARCFHREDLFVFVSTKMAVKLTTLAMVALGCVYIALGITQLYQLTGYKSLSAQIAAGVLYHWVGVYPTMVTMLLRIIIPNSAVPGDATDQNRVPDDPHAYPLLPLRGDEGAGSRWREW
ncbi:hypothetical protein AURDEDRAFT_163814 [Auricularia subglabra TFB-10046 SS5]|nr:hypothetical protein AURDEDRAFT_163814 [Auricularia subglabra TFB-10046 SS5]